MEFISEPKKKEKWVGVVKEERKGRKKERKREKGRDRKEGKRKN